MLNQCSFIGNVGKQPEIRNTQAGTKVASFSLAVNESWKGKDGQKHEKTEWVNVVIWSEGLVKVVESYVNKGDKLYISGKLQTRKWQDKEGHDKYTTEIVLQGFDAKLVMLGGKAEKPEEKQDDFNDDIQF